MYDCAPGGTAMSFFFHYNKRGFDYLTIHTSGLLLHGSDIYGCTLAELLPLMRACHSDYDKKLVYAYEESDDEAFVDFKQISLSLWLEQGRVSDIVVYG